MPARIVIWVVSAPCVIMLSAFATYCIMKQRCPGWSMCKQVMAQVLRRGLFFIAPSVLVMGVLVWVFLHPASLSNASTIVIAALVREGIAYALLALAAALVLACGYVDLSQAGVL